MSKYCIVAIGYNRVNSIKRLLNSLDRVDYGQDDVDLIISIDNSGNNELEKFAYSFSWSYGQKIIKTYQKRLGLREHVLTCGDYVDDYEAIAVLEDDIYVSPNFYNYMKQAVSFYESNTNIAGISLYTHLWSEYNSRPFYPAKNKYDVFFMQFAQSWGQIWTKNQWKEFKKWYDSNNQKIEHSNNIPQNISSWPESSWLKYHIKYCIDNNKYFVYPYESLSTNFTDPGQHCKYKSTIYQVPMIYDNYKKYDFVDFNSKDAVKYDVFFERECIGKFINVSDHELCVDLYGDNNKSNAVRYYLTTKKCDYKILKSFALELRPHEMNVINNIKGDAIFLYDTNEQKKNNSSQDLDLAKWYYDFKTRNYKIMVKVLFSKTTTKLLKMINKR